VVCAFHRIYNPAEYERAVAECKSGARGCVDCKKQVAVKINERLEPIRIKRLEIDRNPGAIEGMITDGNERAKKAAGETMREVRRLMKLG
jgi:tryptophanyl-tRNA synthetase